jgi:tripartite-type tricarboxylate transporter receptor subunit TctC
VKLLNVPYKGGGEIMSAVVGGQVMLFFSSIPAGALTRGIGKASRGRGLTRSRVPSLPDVPTIAESGVPDFDVSGWFAFFVPTGTPRPVIDKIADAVNSTVKDPQISKQFSSQGHRRFGHDARAARLVRSAGSEEIRADHQTGGSEDRVKRGTRSRFAGSGDRRI